MRLTCFILLCVFCSLSTGCFILGPEEGEQKSEAWFRKKWCESYGGETEVVMPDESQCDCVIKEHVVEITFAENWANAIGPALHYAMLSERKAGIVLILESEEEWTYWYQLETFIHHYNLPIDTWMVVGY